MANKQKDKSVVNTDPLADLLSEIQGGANLRKVSKTDQEELEPKPDGSKQKSVGNSLQDALKERLGKRRQHIEDDDEEEEQDMDMDEEVVPSTKDTPKMSAEDLKAYSKELQKLLSMVNGNLDKINVIDRDQVQGKHKIETFSTTKLGLENLKTELTDLLKNKQKGKEIEEYIVIQAGLERGVNLVSPKAKIVPMASELPSASGPNSKPQNLASEFTKALAGGASKKEVDRPRVGRLDLGAQEAGFGKLFEKPAKTKENSPKATGQKQDKTASTTEKPPAKTTTMPVLPENINHTKEDLLAAIKILQNQVAVAISNDTHDPEGKFRMQAGKLKKFMDEVSGVENLDTLTAEGYIARMKAFNLAKPESSQVREEKVVLPEVTQKPIVLPDMPRSPDTVQQPAAPVTSQASGSSNLFVIFLKMLFNKIIALFMARGGINAEGLGVKSQSLEKGVEQKPQQSKSEEERDPSNHLHKVIKDLKKAENILDKDKSKAFSGGDVLGPQMNKFVKKVVGTSIYKSLEEEFFKISPQMGQDILKLSSEAYNDKTLTPEQRDVLRAIGDKLAAEIPSKMLSGSMSVKQGFREFLWTLKMARDFFKENPSVAFSIGEKFLPILKPLQTFVSINKDTVKQLGTPKFIKKRFDLLEEHSNQVGDVIRSAIKNPALPESPWNKKY